MKSRYQSRSPAQLEQHQTIATLASIFACAHNGKPIANISQLQSFSYGTKTQHLATSHDPFTYDLYQSTNSPDSDDSDTEMSPFIEKKKNPWFLTSIGQKNKLTPSKGPAKPAARAGPKTSPQAAGGDPAVLALQKANAAEEAKKKENT